MNTTPLTSVSQTRQKDTVVQAEHQTAPSPLPKARKSYCQPITSPSVSPRFYRPTAQSAHLQSGVISHLETEMLNQKGILDQK